MAGDRQLELLSELLREMAAEGPALPEAEERIQAHLAAMEEAGRSVELELVRGVSELAGEPEALALLALAIEVDDRPEVAARCSAAALTVPEAASADSPISRTLSYFSPPATLFAAEPKTELDEGMVEPLVEKARELLEPGLPGAARFWSWVERLPPTLAMAVARELRGPNDESLLPALSLLALHPDTEVAREALRGLGTITLPGALTALEKLSDLEPPLAEEVERAARKLRFRGIEPEPASAPRADETVEGAWGGSSSSQRYHLLLRPREQAADLVLGVDLDLSDGLRSWVVTDGHEPGEGYQERANRLEAESGAVPVDGCLGLDLLRHALFAARPADPRSRPALLIARQVLGPVDLTPRRFRLPVEAEAHFRDLEGGVTLQELGEERLYREEDPFRRWYLDSAVVRRFLSARLQRIRSADEGALALVDEAGRELVGKDPEAMIDRLAIAGLFMLRSQPPSSVALLHTVGTWSSMVRGIPWDELGLTRVLVERTLLRAYELLEIRCPLFDRTTEACQEEG